MRLFGLFKKKGMDVLVRIDFKKDHSKKEMNNLFQGLKKIASQWYKRIEIVTYISNKTKVVERINLICFDATFYDSDKECASFENHLKDFLEKNKIKFDMHFTIPRSFEEETKYKTIKIKKYANEVTKKDVDDFEKALKEGKVFQDVYQD